MHGELTSAQVSFKMVAINRPGYTVHSGNLCPATQKFPVLQDVASSDESSTAWHKFAGQAPPYCNDCMWIFYPNHTLYREYGVVNILESQKYNMVKSHLMLASNNKAYNPNALGPLFTRDRFPIEFGDVKDAASIEASASAVTSAASTMFGPCACGVLALTGSVLFILSCTVV